MKNVEMKSLFVLQSTAEVRKRSMEPPGWWSLGTVRYLWCGLVISVENCTRKKGRSKWQIIEPLGRLQRNHVGMELKVIYRTEK